MKDLILDLESLKKAAEPLEFLTEGSPITEEGLSIINDIKEVMENDKSILALSAPQLGIEKRIFCIRFNDTIKAFINPIIIKKAKMIIAPETFINMPGKEILIARPEELTVIYYNDKFEYEENKLLGAAARLFDQQAQVLDGILPDAFGLVSDVAEDGSLADATPEEIEQYCEIYKQFVEKKKAALEASINENPEEAKQYKYLKYTEKVINGEIQVVEDPELTKAKSSVKTKIDNSFALSGKAQVDTTKMIQRNNLAKLLNKKRGK